MRLTERLAALQRARRRAVPHGPPPCVGCHGDRDRLEPVEAGDIAATTPDSVVGPVDAVQIAAVDDALVVLHPSTGRRVLLNPTGGLIYTAIDTERPVVDVIAQLAAETGADAATITPDVLATLDRLVGQGLLTRDDLIDPAGDDGPEVAVGVDPTPVIDATVERAEPTHWAYRSGVRTAAGATISVRAEATGLADLVEAALAGFADASADTPGDATRAVSAGHASSDRAHDSADHRIDLVAAGGADDDAVRLVFDDGAPTGPLDRGVAVARLFDQVDVALAESAPGLRFHAGAVERDGRVVLVLGNSGDGKSTLTAALVQAGWRYVTDELVVVDPTSFRVHPYARPLSLDAAARAALGIDDADLRTGSPKDKVLPARLGAVSTGGTPALVVLLTGTRDDRPSDDGTVTVPAAEALMALLTLTFERTFDDPGALAALAELCERVTVIRLGRAPSTEMVAIIERALAQ